MFYGEYRHTLDAKNRLIIPARFREAIYGSAKEEKCYVTRGLEKCLFAFPPLEWEVLKEKVKSLTMMKASARAFSRILFSGAAESDFDKQGRIMLPQHLLEYAGIQKDAVIVGVMNRFEIWDKGAWDSFSQNGVQSFERLAEELVDL